MDRNEVLTEMQRRIAAAKGYTSLGLTPGTRELHGILHADEGPTLVPRWPWDMADAWPLVMEMRQAPGCDGYQLEDFAYPPNYAEGRPKEFRLWFEGKVSRPFEGRGNTEAEAIARCWCAWKGIDLSDIGTEPPR